MERQVIDWMDANVPAAKVCYSVHHCAVPTTAASACSISHVAEQHNSPFGIHSLICVVWYVGVWHGRRR
jgi:hypothetical protein